MIDDYSDIINIDYNPRKKMPLEMRSAQFAPFNALPSYAEKINEVTKVPEIKKELTEEMKSNLNDKLNKIKENIKNKPLVTINYFFKNKYISIKGIVKKIDEINKVIFLEENQRILINEIINIYIEN